MAVSVSSSLDFSTQLSLKIFDLYSKNFDVCIQAFNSGKAPHGWLFYGPPSIGKSIFVENLAAVLLNRTDSTDPLDPIILRSSAQRIQDNEFCHHIKKNHHPQFLYVHYKDNANHSISVDTIRKIHPFVQNTSPNNQWKIVVIDRINKMNPNAYNSLLKILEEPPARTLFFLIADHNASISDTIRSRCSLIKFSGLTEAAVKLYVQELEYSPLNLDLRIDMANGNVSLLQNNGHFNPLDFLEEFHDCFIHHDSANSKTYESIYQFIQKILEKNAYDLFINLLEWWILTVQKILMIQELTESQSSDFSKIHPVISFIIQNNIISLKKLNSHYPKIFSLIHHERSLNLDRKSLLTTLFFILEKMKQ